MPETECAFEILLILVQHFKLCVLCEPATAFFAYSVIVIGYGSIFLFQGPIHGNFVLLYLIPGLCSTSYNLFLSNYSRSDFGKVKFGVYSFLKKRTVFSVLPFIRQLKGASQKVPTLYRKIIN